MGLELGLRLALELALLMLWYKLSGSATGVAASYGYGYACYANGAETIANGALNGDWMETEWIRKISNPRLYAEGPSPDGAITRYWQLPSGASEEYGRIRTKVAVDMEGRPC